MQPLNSWPPGAHDREFFYAGFGGDSWANCPPVVLDQVARFVMSISAATIIDGYNLLHTIGIVPPVSVLEGWSGLAWPC